MWPVFIGIALAFSLIGGILAHDRWRRSPTGVARALRALTPRRVEAVVPTESARIDHYVVASIEVVAATHETLVASLARHADRHGGPLRDQPLLDAVFGRALARTTDEVVRALRADAPPPDAVLAALDAELGAVGLRRASVVVTGACPLTPDLRPLLGWAARCAGNPVHKPRIPVGALALYLDAQRASPTWYALAVDAEGRLLGRRRSDFFVAEPGVRFAVTFRPDAAHPAWGARSFAEMASEAS